MRLSAFLALLVVTSPCFGAAAGKGDSPVPDTRTAAPSNPSVYRISAGDQLYVYVPGEELFTRDCEVSGAGTISYPMLGDVVAAGSTCDELGARLEKGLGEYLKHPKATVTVRQYGTAGTSVFVYGEVRNPGAYPLASGVGFLQAIATAGGLTDAASGTVTLLRPRTGETRPLSLGELAQAGTVQPDSQLQPGDVLLVQRKEEAKYSVLGEVPNPGMFDMPLTGQVHVLDALQRAGVLTTATGAGTEPARPGQQSAPALDDPNRLADYEHTTLTRQGEKTPVNIAALLQGDSSQNLEIVSGDVLTVPRRAAIKTYALGEVRTPGRQMLPVHSTVLDLLNAAGGPTTTARPGRASVLRMVNGTPTAVPIDVGRLYGQADMRQNVALQDGDMLYIPPKKDPRDPMEILRLLPLILATLP
jgi:protein involved in polysaccharide export with SLBB domain